MATFTDTVAITREVDRHTVTYGEVAVMCRSWLPTLLALALQTAVSSAHQCGTPGGLTKIVGGQSVDSLQFPWYVALVSPSGSSTLQVSCGGSLITSRHVLSAAHCFPKTSGLPPEKMYRAVLGLVDRCGQVDGDQRTIARVHLHPSFNPSTLQADVSVVTLDQAVAYTPVCLPPRNFQPIGPAVVIGFGSTLAKSQYPCTLQQAQVKILSRRECARSNLSPEYSHIPGTICAGVPSGGVDSCDGDSGGPIMTIGDGSAYIVQGIVSFGEGCARKNLPGVYTRVSAYRDFIDSTVSSFSSTEDFLSGERDDISSTFIPPDKDTSSLILYPGDPHPLTPPSPDPPSLLDSLWALLLPWTVADSPDGSSSGGGSSGNPSVSGGTGGSRPISPLEYFLLQLFNRRRVRPSTFGALG